MTRTSMKKSARRSNSINRVDGGAPESNIIALSNRISNLRDQRKVQFKKNPLKPDLIGLVSERRILLDYAKQLGDGVYRSSNGRLYFRNYRPRVNKSDRVDMLTIEFSNDATFRGQDSSVDSAAIASARSNFEMSSHAADLVEADYIELIGNLFDRANATMSETREIVAETLAVIEAAK